jgi:two-component system, LytTR family, response regulator
MRVVIVEDEPRLRDTNKTFLKNNFPDMEIVAEAGTVNEAVDAIKTSKPDLVLLDIELADGNCFQVLHQCKPYTFKPVFITAYNQYAIKAIKFSAIDYILKPVNEYEFCNAIQKAVENNQQDEINKQTENFREHYSGITKQKKLVLRTADTMHIIAVDSIIYCKSDNSYTTFFIDDGQEILVSKGIKEYADLLTEYGFLRPHQSYLVNINAISKIDKADGGFIILHNKKEIPISQRRKQIIIDAINNL